MKAKPKPPMDMWERLSKELERIKKTQVEVVLPEGAFTSLQYREQYGFSANQSNKRLQLLQQEGVVERHGHGSRTYYTFVEKA